MTTLHTSAFALLTFSSRAVRSNILLLSSRSSVSQAEDRRSSSEYNDDSAWKPRLLNHSTPCHGRWHSPAPAASTEVANCRSRSASGSAALTKPAGLAMVNRR